VTSHSPATPGTPAKIYLIRHGEKPANPPTGKHAQSPSPPFGVDVDGKQNIHSLLPRGWQRSGALAVLFDPTVGASQAGLRTPTALYSPSYADPDKTQNHRTYQTIQALSERLGVSIQSPVPEGQEPALAAAVLASGGEVVLICWEHQHIPALARPSPRSTPPPSPPRGQATDSTSSGPSLLTSPPDVTCSANCLNNFWLATPTR